MDDASNADTGDLTPEAQFGARLRSAREQQGLSLRELARTLHRAHSSLVEYERGHRLAPVDVVQAYESILGVKAGSLVALRAQAEAQRVAIGRDGSLPDAVGRRAGHDEHGKPSGGSATDAAVAAGTSSPQRRLAASRRVVAGVALAVAAVLVVVVAVVVRGGGDPEPDAPPTVREAGDDGPTSDRATIVAPPGGTVPQCWLFRGTARLRPGRTLVLGVKNLDNNDPNAYFEAVRKWRPEVGRGDWEQPQFFGETPGQKFAVTLFAMPERAIQSVPAKSAPTAWAAPAPPAVAKPVKTLEVSRRAGRGTCPR